MDGDNFDYLLDATRRRIKRRSSVTNQQLLESLKQCAAKSATDVLRAKQYDRWDGRLRGSRQVALIFGSWRSAVEKAGLRPPVGFTKDFNEMVNLYKRCWREHRQAPSTKLFENFLRKLASPYTINMYCGHFGGLERLAKRIVDRKDNLISDAQLFEKYERPGYRRMGISPRIRHLVFVRDGFKCVRCGRNPAEDGVKLVLAHKVPVAGGGSNEEGNLHTLCEECNQGEGTDNVQK